MRLATFWEGEAGEVPAEPVGPVAPQAQQELRLPENYLSYAAQPRELLTVAVWSRASLNDEGSNLQNLLFWFGTFIKTLGTTGKHNRCANLGELLEKRKDL